MIVWQEKLMIVWVTGEWIVGIALRADIGMMTWISKSRRNRKCHPKTRTPDVFLKQSPGGNDMCTAGTSGIYLIVSWLSKELEEFTLDTVNIFSGADNIFTPTAWMLYKQVRLQWERSSMAGITGKRQRSVN